MLSFLKRINLIRYLIVWRVNSSLAYFPRYLPIDISNIIGTIISQRLPTKETSLWQKALEPLNKKQDENLKNRKKIIETFPDVSWPIQSVLFPYTGKRTYGRDELILWELKLLGNDADHGLFLEVILPAIEEASYTSNPKWNRRNRVWGKFDIQAVYVARGHRWEPLVQDGKLDLRYRANHTQWSENLTLTPKTGRRFRYLNWTTPFDLDNINLNLHTLNLSSPRVALKYDDAPTLYLILSALIARLIDLMPGKYKDTEEIINNFNKEEDYALSSVFEKISKMPINKNNIKPAPNSWPGKWSGNQRFKNIPKSIIPYLELASILHIGKYTHLGCGTFMLT